MLNKLFSQLSKKLSVTTSVFLCITLFIINFCYAIPLMLAPMESEGDAYGRAQVYPFTESGIFKTEGSVWLPLHQTFINLTQFLPGDGIMGPRYLTLLASCMVPILIFLLTRIITKHAGVSFIMGILLVFFPLFREIGATTLSETFFLALLLGACLSLLQNWYVSFAVLFSLSQMTRFESWFLIPWLGILVALIKKASLSTKIILISCCLIFPIIYSIASYTNNGSSIGYVREMNTMALRGMIDGRGDFPFAVRRWVETFWKAVPMSFVVLFLVGLVVIFQRHQKSTTDSQRQQFVFAVLPIFLLLMLPIQLFLPFRDWLPIRYILIPTVLMFPLMGLGLLSLVQRFDLRRFWQWYVLGALFIGFELYSLNLQTHRLISTYTHVQFEEIYETVDLPIKEIIGRHPDTQLYIFNPSSHDPEIPNIDIEFVRYFLLPYRPQVAYVAESNLIELLMDKSHKKIIMSTITQNLPAAVVRTPIFEGQYYRFFFVE